MSVISRVGDFSVLIFYICIYRYGSSLSVYSTLRRILVACLTQQVSLVVFFISFFTHKQEHKRQSEVSLTTQLNWYPHYSLLQACQLSRGKGYNYTDSQAHSQARSQACRCLGWQNRGVSEIGDASPSSSATKQNNFYPVLNRLILFHHDPDKRYDPKISILSEPTTK